MTSLTEEEAKTKHCPIIQKHCKGTYCMMFTFINEEVREVVDPKKPLNKPKRKAVSLYMCGLKREAVDNINVSLT